MKFLLIFFSILICATVYSQENSFNLLKIDIAKTLQNKEQLKNVVDGALTLKIEDNIYKTIAESRKAALNLTIPVSPEKNIYLTLERFEILSPDAKITERSSKGERELDLRNIVLSYKGEVAGKENSVASISFYNGKLTGVIYFDNENYVIGPLSDKNNNETGDIVIYSENKLKAKNNIRCGSEAFNVPDEIVKTINKINGQPIERGLAELLDAKIAIDIDYYTYTVYQNSVANASAYALAVASAASAVYCKDMNIRLSVGYLRVWTTQDPYTSSNGNTLLDQFRFDWIANQGSVDRVIAHLITRRSLDVGGIAYLNVLCNTNLGYGLSAVTGVINQLPAYSYDVVVVAHEIGHNFGSPHTHSCSWVGGPIDTCYIVEGGCYSGPSHPTVGTIMSYCDTEGGTVVMDFGTQPEALIRSRAENAFCIAQSTRPIITAYPNGGELFKTLTTARIYWGTSVTGNVNLEYTSDNGSSWNTIQNNVPAPNREFAWTVPYISYTNQAKVRILNSNNSSEGDTSDAPFKIILTYNAFQVLSPPSLTTIETTPSGTGINRFVWSSTGAHPSFRYKFKIRKLGAGAVDYIYDSDNGGTDTAISFRNSFLDSLAFTLGTIGDSVRCSWRGWAYNGYDSAQSATSFIVTLKRTGVGINMISSIVPEKFSLENNYPNPFNPTTNIKFDIAKTTFAELSIYDSRGREVGKLVNEKLTPGSYEYSFNAVNLPSGAYFYRLKTSEFTQTKRMILIK